MTGAQTVEAKTLLSYVLMYASNQDEIDTLGYTLSCIRYNCRFSCFLSVLVVANQHMHQTLVPRAGDALR
jgi:hypothetical protein